MPHCRGIHIALQSQYDALVLPEFPTSAAHVTSPPKDKDPNDSTHSASAHVPIYSGSQFWICYACPLPSLDSETRFYYFKLVVDGRCLLSWGSGEAEGWCGKISFGYYATESCEEEGRESLEKRSFFFPLESAIDKEKLCEDDLEVRVFRAKARRRIGPQFEPWVQGSGGSSIQVRTSGPVKRGDSRRFYNYALIDPVDTPYATVSYQFRTRSQLEASETESSIKLVGKNGVDITTASPSRRPMSPLDVSPLSHNMLPPPPRTKPAPPPENYPAKDSIALRRLSLPPRIPLRFTSSSDHDSPVKKSQREKAMFDALEGLSLVNKSSSAPKKMQKKELLEEPKCSSTTGLFNFGKRFSRRRMEKRDEQMRNDLHHAK